MAKTQRKVQADGILLQCRAPEARQVFLAGTFNNWDSRANPMEPAGDGVWSLRLALPPGRHEYKFLIDGEWCCTPGDDQSVCNCVPNAFGTMNLIIEIPEVRSL
ncbi:MAG: glycoside hydrolase family 13 [Nitrospira sp. CR1.3]|nr:glycoside hydrolase family 13 [Nitrospira sp. CR1.3]